MLGILEKISPSELVSNGYFSNHNKLRRPCPKFKVSFFYIFLLFLNQCYSNKLWKHQKTIRRIISNNCFQLKSRLMLMLERPLSHCWTSPLNRTNTIWHLTECFPAQGYTVTCQLSSPLVTDWICSHPCHCLQVERLERSEADFRPEMRQLCQKNRERPPPPPPFLQSKLL